MFQIKNFIQSFENLKYKNKASIIIVDNESTSKSKESLNNISLRSTLDIKVIFSSNNLFYWGAANYALKKLNLDINNFPDWIPDGIFNVDIPSRVGISILVPKTASG